MMARDEERGKAAAKKIKEEFGVNCVFYKGDVVSQEDCEKTVSSFIEDFGGINVMINNSGLCRHRCTLDMGPDFKDWYDVINVNLNGVFLMSYFSAKYMKEHGGGSIINISSISATMVNAPQYQCSYNCSKAAVNHLTESLAVEWAPFNIRVNAIEPGYSDTEMTLGLAETNEISRAWYKTWRKACPTDRFLAPIECGALCVYLGSDASEYCRGSIFTIDGGYKLPR
jgi:NAD(P)-dependent dehydrogenase (short-subunit alcohol dehydrogenase family)